MGHFLGGKTLYFKVTKVIREKENYRTIKQSSKFMI